MSSSASRRRSSLREASDASPSDQEASFLRSRGLLFVWLLDQFLKIALATFREISRNCLQFSRKRKINPLARPSSEAVM